MNSTHARLDLYARPAISHQRDRLLQGMLSASLLIFGVIGLLLLTVDLTPLKQRVRAKASRITFHAPPAPVIEPEPVIAEPEPIELPEEAVLAQAVDVPVIIPDPVPVPVMEAPVEPTPPPRRVYGVRKVLATGLGNGSGGMQTGIVVKRGNVLDGVADDLTATDDDLKGELAALSTVERAPEPLRRVKPKYSEELVDARVSGTVTARLLIDTDGTVARVEITEDIGHDSAQVAAEALRQFTFRPALRRGEPVAVWIIHRIRFEFQE